VKDAEGDIGKGMVGKRIVRGMGLEKMDSPGRETGLPFVTELLWRVGAPRQAALAD